MFARVVIVQIDPDRTDEAISLYGDSVVPAAEQQQGFRGMYLLTSGTGKGISIALWETEADMQAGETSGYLQEQINKFGALFTAPPVTEHYDVSVQA